MPSARTAWPVSCVQTQIIPKVMEWRMRNRVARRLSSSSSSSAFFPSRSSWSFFGVLGQNHQHTVPADTSHRIAHHAMRVRACRRSRVHSSTSALLLFPLLPFAPAPAPAPPTSPVKNPAESTHSTIQNIVPAAKLGLNTHSKKTSIDQCLRFSTTKNRLTTVGSTSATGRIRYSTRRGGSGTEREAKNVTWQ